ncbi:unnamed protein product, partial [Bemisia tabaci]
LPNYCYNAATNRFVKCCGITFTNPVHRDKPPQMGHAYLWGSNQLNLAYTTIYSQYTGFVGPCHMRHMCRLLGYQGIAVVMEELLKIVKLLIQGNLLQFTKTLMEAMPKTCKLPRYDYGSPGVLGYYRAQLNDIVQYPAARMELFHNFQGEKPEVKLRKLEAKFNSLHVVAHVEKLGSAKGWCSNIFSLLGRQSLRSTTALY